MVKGRLRAAWAQTSSLMALIANVNRDPKVRKQPFTPADFDPHSPPRKQEVHRVDMETLWQVVNIG